MNEDPRLKDVFFFQNLYCIEPRRSIVSKLPWLSGPFMNMYPVQGCGNVKDRMKCHQIFRGTSWKRSFGFIFVERPFPHLSPQNILYPSRRLKAES